MRFPKLMPLGILCLTIPLISCQTPPIAAQQSPSSPVKAIPCVEVPVIAYHAPQTAAEAGAWLLGTLPDPKNLYDTPSTAIAIRKANAARQTVCGP